MLLSVDDAATTGGPDPSTCPPFDVASLKRQLSVDRFCRWCLLAMLGLGVGMASVAASHTIHVVAGSIVLLVAVAWIAMSMLNARVARALPAISDLVAQDPGAAEAVLAEALARWPLQPSVRLLLYHRLAMVRHRQRRLAEAAAICHAVLDHAWHLPREARAHLLLILVEAHLYHRDLVQAYHGLVQLHRVALNLVEVTQRLPLQLRYEILAGHDQAALRSIDRKIQMAELLPADQCGLVHLLLAMAAGRSGQTQLARWLKARAELVCSAEKIQSMAWISSHGNQAPQA